MTVSADTVRLAVVEEATIGDTPSTPAYDLMRMTGEGLTYNVNTTNSDEVGGLNRGTKDNILVGATVTGDINFELSQHKALEEFMAAALGNTWAGDPLSIPGAGANNVYNAFNRRTFTIEKRLTLDETPTYDYHRFTGCMIDTLALSITPNDPITGTLGFVGNEMVTATSEIAGSTYAAAGTNPIMTSPLVTGIELLSPAGINDTTGVPLGSPVAWLDNSCFMGLDLNFNNNARAIECIGELGTRENNYGRFEGTSTGSLYYNGKDPLDALIAQSEFALRVTMSDKTGESYEFLLPRVVFSEASAPVSGTNTDVMTEFNLTILEYQGSGYALSAQITRSSAASAGFATILPVDDDDED